jgi:hypothetical protein
MYRNPNGSRGSAIIKDGIVWHCTVALSILLDSFGRDGQSKVGHAALISRSSAMACELRARNGRGAKYRRGQRFIVADRRTSSRNRVC